MDLRITKRVQRLMGNRFELSVVSSNEIWANDIINGAIGEIQRIETLLTTYDENSQTNQINAQAGIRPVAVDREVFDLIARSCRISKLTQGAFDITYGSIDKSLWNFDLEMKTLPSPEQAKRLVRLINYENIVLDEARCTVYLKEAGMRIGFGGIGKGYAAEMAKKWMKQHGVEHGVVNASGDLTTWGQQPDGTDWTIGLADPNAKDQPFSILKISDMAVATSGSYEKYITINNKRYSHTINPKTGLPVEGIKSVTVISASAELSDALTTPIAVMGVGIGLNMINQIPGVACVIIDDADKVYTSDLIKTN